MDRGDPIASDSRILRVKTAVDVAIKTFHNIVNVQNVFGFEIS